MWARGGHGNPLQCSCLENPHAQRSGVGHSPWGRRVGHDGETMHRNVGSLTVEERNFYLAFHSSAPPVQSRKRLPTELHSVSAEKGLPLPNSRIKLQNGGGGEEMKERECEPTSASEQVCGDEQDGGKEVFLTRFFPVTTTSSREKCKDAGRWRRVGVRGFL